MSNSITSMSNSIISMLNSIISMWNSIFSMLKSIFVAGSIVVRTRGAGGIARQVTDKRRRLSEKSQLASEAYSANRGGSCDHGGRYGLTVLLFRNSTISLLHISSITVKMYLLDYQLFFY